METTWVKLILANIQNDRKPSTLWIKKKCLSKQKRNAMTMKWKKNLFVLWEYYQRKSTFVRPTITTLPPTIHFVLHNMVFFYLPHFFTSFFYLFFTLYKIYFHFAHHSMNILPFILFYCIYLLLPRPFVTTIQYH